MTLSLSRLDRASSTEESSKQCIENIYHNVDALTDFAIVLDLDETLVHTFPDMSSLAALGNLSTASDTDLRMRHYVIEMDDVMTPIGTGDRQKMWGIIRPYTNQFLRFCFGYFKYVIVWSAGIARYVRQIVEVLFSGLHHPDVVYTRSNCISQNVNNKVFTTKPLQSMIDQTDIDLDFTRMFALDDKWYTYINNNNNGVLIPGYEPDADREDLRADDNSLLQFMSWLLTDKVISSSDVREVDKNNIFSSLLSVSLEDVNILICEAFSANL